MNDHSIKWRPLRALAAAGLLVIIGLAGCGNKNQTAQVERRDIVVYDTLSGQVNAPPAAQANIVSPYEAPVEKIDVTVGADVKKGDVLVELSSPPNEAFYQQARQRVIQARQRVAQVKQQYAPQIQQAQRQVRQAQQAVAQAKKSTQVQVPAPPTTAQPGPTPPAATPPPGGQLPTAQPTAGRMQVGQVAGTSPQLAQAQLQLQQAQQNLADVQAQQDRALAPYEQQLAIAEQELQDAQAGTNAATIRTPITGTVIAINTQTGQTVSPNQKQPVVVVVDLNAVKVYAGANKQQAAQIQTNDPATVTISDIPNTSFPGSVQQIYTQKAGLLQGASYVVVVGFENKEGQAKPGMNGQASIQVDKATNVLAVPASAVYQTSNNENAVQVQRNGQWQEQVVVIGLSNGEYTEIRSGLQQGDVVRVNPQT